MLNFIEYLKIPQNVAFVLVCIFFVFQVVGEFLEFKGKVVPEAMKIRKYFYRKKKEREALSKMTDFYDDYRKTKDENREMCTTLEDVKKLLNDVSQHYSEDNITKRDGWMQEVNYKIDDLYSKQEERDARDAQLNEKMDKNNEITLSILIDNKRNYILDFTSKAVDMSYPLTREQYQRFFNIHKEYEEILEQNGMSNGQVDVAYDVVTKSFEERLKQHTFIEDIRGYNV